MTIARNMLNLRLVEAESCHSRLRGTSTKANCGFPASLRTSDADNSLNRILKAAARTVAGSRSLPLDLRQRATWLLRPFDQVGDLHLGDLSVALERRSGWYSDALGLAWEHSSWSRTGRVEAGDHGVWTFLFKTADLIEQGVRQVLVAGLPSVAITKQGMLLRPSSLSLTPDLRFGTDMAVGDVKYKLTGMDWNRNDLYQAVTFGTGFGCSKVAVIAFRTTASLELPRVRVGNVEVVPFCWNCSDAATS